MSGICRAPDCENPKAPKSSMCHTHKARWWRYKSYDLPDWRAGASCSAPDCAEPVYHREPLLCRAHYFRLWRTGTLGTAPVRGAYPARIAAPVRVAHPCAAPDCDTTVWATYCDLHATRFRRYGTTELLGGPAPRYGAENTSWTGDGASYSAVHLRLNKTLGSARHYPCVGGCGGAAAQWAFDHEAPTRRLDPLTGPYSTSLDDYRPMCVSCHKRYDLAHR